MARVSTYLNFQGKTEEAFEFYRSIFGGEFTEPGIYRIGDAPADSIPPLSEAEKQLVMHVELAILDGHVLMATDSIESMGHVIETGNNMSINLEPDTRAETERLFAGLAEGANDVMPLTDMFWGSYFGSLQDRYGIRWMFNCSETAE